MFSFSANGETAVPQVILPGKRVRKEAVEGFPADWVIGLSERGWMTADLFRQYIEKAFHPSLVKLQVKFPVILFVDGHVSHKALEVADLCRSLDIVLISLYPNTTHITQPCDVAVFKPLKDQYRRTVQDWKNQHYGEVHCLTHFGRSLSEAVTAGIKPQCLTNGFRVCGLFPFNAGNVDYTKCLAVERNIHDVTTVEAPTIMPSNTTICDVVEVPSQIVQAPVLNIQPLDSELKTSRLVSVPIEDIITCADIIDSKTLERIQVDLEDLTREERMIRFLYNRLIKPYMKTNSIQPSTSVQPGRDQLVSPDESRSLPAESHCMYCYN